MLFSSLAVLNSQHLLDQCESPALSCCLSLLNDGVCVCVPQAILMMFNSVAILNNERFLEKCEWVCQLWVGGRVSDT
jgi:hypothetical protein